MSTENPQRITFWHCHIRAGPYAARHVARRRSHLCCAPLALSPSTILWVTGHQRFFGATIILSCHCFSPLLCIHPSIRDQVEQWEWGAEKFELKLRMATSMITSPLVAPARAKGLPSISRRGSSFAIVCSGGKKIKTDKPYGLKLKLSSEFRLRNVLLIIVEWVSVAEFVWFILFLFLFFIFAGIGGGMSVDIDASGRKSTVRTCPQLLNFSMFQSKFLLVILHGGG